MIERRQLNGIIAGALCAGCAVACTWTCGRAVAQTVPLDPLPFVALRADATAQQAAEGPLALAVPVRLGDYPARFLALGLDVRERYEHYGNAGFGLLGLSKQQDYLLSRVMVSGDLWLGPDVRGFVQLGRHDAPGKSAVSPVDADRVDVQQAFVEASLSLGDTRGTLRVGRQEILLGAGRFVDIREGPNVRQSHDGARAFVTFGNGVRLDLFLVRPVLTRQASFDDTADPHQLFGGAYLTVPVIPGPAPGGALSVDAYGYALQTKNTRTAAGLVEDSRATVGLRVYGRPGPFDHDTELVFQGGTQGRTDIRAGGMATKLGYTAQSLPLTPRFGIQADYFTGSRDPAGRTVNTFNPLFPRGGYFSEPGLQTFANLIDVFPSVTVNPSPVIAVQVGVDFTWRESTHDAVYIAPGIPLPGTAAARGRYIGTNDMLQASWSVTRWLSVNGSYVHASAGPAITNAGGRSTNYAAAWTTFRF